ncbi:MAG: hypothetical protein PUD93_10910 [Lachnospiraceae bacterium]|nr:hypothetical protein [Lachnospiraceae bacterium]
MKKNIIKSIYLFVVFVAVLFIASTVMNKGNTDMTTEMREASFPVVTMQIEDYAVNSLYGYDKTMDTSCLRDTILPIEEDRKAAFVIDTYGNEIRSLAFEVRSINGERLVESTQIENYEQEENRIICNITLKDLIDTQKEYMLVILLTMSDGETIRYYTRIVQSEKMHIREKLAYVLDFHNRTFDREAAADLTKYLESNAEGDNTTFHKVNIHSSFQQVTWGDLVPERMTEPVVDIKELEEQTGSFQLEYLVRVRDGKETTQYQVKEYYRVRYTPDRMYLLDFEREMTQIFDEKAGVTANDKIILGIVDKQVEMLESDGGNVVAFVVSDKLYSYNVTDKKLARLFSFYDEEDIADARNRYDRHEIKILNVDEAGNVEFLVYGYMNRGRHEGEVGVSVYSYSSTANTVEEHVYIPYNRSYQMLKSDIEELAYINKSGICYLMLEGSVYAINLVDREYSIIVSGLTEEEFTVSESNKMLVWQEGNDKYSCTALKLLNLGTETETEITAGAGEYISLLGFMEEDLIYGLAKKQDVVYETGGITTFPMYCLKIQSENGDLLKTYHEDDIYVTGGVITENQITLSRVEWNEDDGCYLPVKDDQIMSTEKTQEGHNKVEAVAVDKYETIVEIAVKEEIDTKALKILTPKEVLFEGSREIAMQDSEITEERFYVYGRSGIEGVYTQAAKAVDHAYEIAGVVVNDNGDYVWKKSTRSSKNQIMAIEGEQVTEQTDSLSVCLDTILELEGAARHTKYLLDQGKTIHSILEDSIKNAQVLDLEGCRLDAVLYYVNMDIPVLAMLEDGNAVLIVGFNELNIVIMDPITGTIYKKGMNDSTQWLEENGNSFITYIRKEEN